MLEKAFKAIQDFIRLETVSGFLLLGAACLALILDNSPLQYYYQLIQHTPFTVGLNEFSLSKPLLSWVNEGLMAIFFLLVGLEIKYEIVAGTLNTPRKLALPAIAAVGGMMVPGIIYVLLNLNDEVGLRGWAIPTATDIAFALGVLKLLGPRVPLSLKMFLTALAILDDLGAIIIIAIFYTHDLSYVNLSLAIIPLIGLLVLNYLKVMRIAPYVLVGIVFWLLVLKSGVHATLAGVLIALAIPMGKHPTENDSGSPLLNLQNMLHPWVAYAVLPIFGFFNAGVSFAGVKLNILWDTTTLGIILGLFFGKQIGVFGATYFAVKGKFAELPPGADWHLLYGISILCGIGFTMSLFIGTLAFGPQHEIDSIAVRVGVLTASLLASVVGYIYLYFLTKGDRNSSL